MPEVRVPGVNGGANVTGGVRVNEGGVRVRTDGSAGVNRPGGNAGIRIDGNLRPAGVNFPGNRNAAANQAIYRNNINIGQRSLSIAPNTYRPSYQNYNWHRGYWNNTYGWNPQIGYGGGFGGYGNYGGYGIRLGNIGIGTGGLEERGIRRIWLWPLSDGLGLRRLGTRKHVLRQWLHALLQSLLGRTRRWGQLAYNYAQPIYVTTSSAAPAEIATTNFDAAREAFQVGDYATALSQVNLAIKENPSDEVLHEFLALTLFAQKDYSGAAATIHSVLAVGPGWDWATMASLYGNDVGQYTAQLRALENFTKSNSDDAGSQFLLGYHYMTTGHPESAAKEFASVVKLQPKDQVAKDLLALVNKPKDGDVATAPAPREEAAPVSKPDENLRPIDAAAIAGQWKSSREDGSKFDLDLRKDKTFSWKFDQGSRHEDIQGTFTTEGSLLLLQKKDGGSMVGHVAQDGEGKFTFKLLGAPADDPGLTFSR